MVWLLVKNAFCNLVKGAMATSELQINIKGDKTYIVSQSDFVSPTQNDNIITSANCNQPHILKFKLPRNMFCNTLKTLKYSGNIKTNACTLTLEIQEVAKGTNVVGAVSNMISIIQEPPMVTKVDLIHPEQIDNIHLLTVGVLPTNGNGIIRIHGTNFGNSTDVNKLAVYFNSKKCKNLKLITDHETVTCTITSGHGVGKDLKVFVGIVDKANGESRSESGANLGIGHVILSYAPPLLSKIIPNHGPTTGNFKVNITGRNFGNRLDYDLNLDQYIIAFIGNVNCTVSNIYNHGATNNDDIVEVVVNEGQGGPLVVAINIDKQPSINNVVFTYDNPTIESVTQNNGPTSGHYPFLTYNKFKHGSIQYEPTSKQILGTGTQFTVDVKHNGTWIRYVDPKTKHHVTYTIAKVIDDTTLSVVDERTSPPGIKVNIGTTNYQLASRKILTIVGSNFGLQSNKHKVQIVFENAALDFQVNVPSFDIISIGKRHDFIKFYQPIGFGANLILYVSVSGIRNAQKEKTTFDYDVAKITSVTPYCGSEYNRNTGMSKLIPCMNDYVSNSGGLMRTNGFESDGCSVKEESCLNSTDMYNKPCVGLSEWEPYGVWQARLRGVPASEVDLQENRRQCGTKIDRRWQMIVIKGTNFASSGGRIITPDHFITVAAKRRACDCPDQMPCMDANTFVCSKKITTSGNCPGTNTLDCTNELQRNRHTTVEENLLAKCPPNMNVDSLNDINKCDEDVFMHEHDEIWVKSVPGYGRNVSLYISINGQLVATSSYRYKKPFVQAVVPYRVNADSGRQADGSSTFYDAKGGNQGLIFVGRNFGFPSDTSITNFTKYIQISIGHEYGRDGAQCNTNECMKLCTNVQWRPKLPETIARSSGLSEVYLDHPYITCTPSADVAGGRNITLSIYGQTDDCTTNPLLCSRIDPRKWPSIRTSDNNNNLVHGMDAREIRRGGKREFGPLFSCGEKGGNNQYYGNANEICVPINASQNRIECADEYCTLPRAKKGFYRLKLNVELVRKGKGQTTSSPCGVDNQNNDCIFKQPKDAKEALGFYYKDWETSESRLQRYRWTPFPDLPCNYDKECATKKLGSVCATKALWKDVPLEQSSDSSMDGLCAIPSFVPLCHKQRLSHIIEPEDTLKKYPAIKPGSNCYGVVACTPPNSCLGNNVCGHGYDFGRNKCLSNVKAYSVVANPSTGLADIIVENGTKRCVDDNDCTEEGNECTPVTPEYCKICKKHKQTDTYGTCVCSHGAPRCGLCSLPLPSYRRNQDRLVYESLRLKLAMEDPPILTEDDGITKGTFEKRMKELEDDIIFGFYRRDGECQKCPKCVVCIIIGLTALVLTICAMAIYFDKEKSKINFAFLSIGVDYFQVISLFAQTGIPWPPWLKEILQWLSIFNFNIDIAAPECIIPDFDYTLKWWGTMMLPLVIASVLLVFFIAGVIYNAMCDKDKRGKEVRGVSAHGHKIVALWVIVMYYLYIMVTQRAFSIFDCNPSTPPDGYRYTSFTSVNCNGGLCRCNDEDERTQLDLQLPAIIFIILYTLGYPLFVTYVIVKHKNAIKEDQILRANGLGDTENTNPHAFLLRKRFHKLYYHFKPGKVYWMLPLLARKAVINIFMLIFRANTIFMYAAILMVLFLSYIAQVKHNPFMSPLEQQNVRRNHQTKRIHAQTKLDAIEEWERKSKLSTIKPKPPLPPTKDELLHLKIYKNIEVVLKAKDMKIR
jgi:hypothetical protein